MTNKISVGMILLALWAAGCATMNTGSVGGEISGLPGTSGIHESFASKTLLAGDTWKVYLKASDPKGGMRSIAAVVSMPGQGDYPVSWTKVGEENAKELNGYIYLNTNTSQGSDFLTYQNLTLKVQIKDDTGYSKPVNFPLYFDPRATRQEPPPAGVFSNRSLGPILVDLRPTDSDSMGPR